MRSDNIDDRVGRLIHEINLGARDPNIRRIVAEVLRGRTRGKWSVPPRAWPQEVKALYDYTIQNVRYTLDPKDLELFQSPSRSLEMGIGDCDDLTILLGTLLTHAGYPVQIRVIGMRHSNTFSHVYLRVGIPPNSPRKWISLDPSREDKPMGWEFPAHKVGLHREYAVDDQEGYL